MTQHQTTAAPAQTSEPTMVDTPRTRPLRFVLALSLPALAIGCATPPLHEPPAQREPPLEEAAQPGHGASADDAGANLTNTSADPSIDPNFDKDLTFEERVERFMAESEAFREAIASIRLIDTIPEGFTPAKVETSATGMTCNKPQGGHELNRTPTEEVTGDPLRQVPLLARLERSSPATLSRA